MDLPPYCHLFPGYMDSREAFTLLFCNTQVYGMMLMIKRSETVL